PASPADRVVWVRSLPPGARVGEAALRLEPGVGAGVEVRDRVGREELGPDTAARGLGRAVLRARLADLDPPPVLRLGPGASGTVEAVRLVHPGQRLEPRPHRA